MLPETGDILKQDFTIQRQPSETYCLEDGRIRGYTDGLKAVEQTVFCILNTERFEQIIYSWNYGVEFRALYGESMEVVKSRIKKRIREALTQDDRIRDVGAFSFSREGKTLSVSFTVTCGFGDFQVVKEVKVNV